MTFETRLRALCQSTTNDVFAQLETLHFEICQVGRQRYAYRPGATASSPLVVCHADTVVNGGNGQHNYSYNKKKAIVTSIALDDRLGIACMVHGIEAQTPLADCAMLVCDEEEIGNTSASVFRTDNSPNWMVELDRRGTDVVAYEYDSTLLRSLLTSAGFVIGHGSFSDISALTHLGVIGFNVGVGYHMEHSKACHAHLVDTFAQLDKLYGFLARFGDVRLDFDPVADVVDDYEYDYHSYHDWPKDDIIDEDDVWGNYRRW